MRTPLRVLLIALATALAGVLLIYLPSLQYDLYSEDFVSLRPWPPGILWQTMVGTWQNFPDAPGFYRPVSTLYYAAAFDLFGLNAAPLHVLPLVVVTISGWLVGLFVWRESRSVAMTALAAAIYVTHPATTTAVGPWIANQYQGFATICALVALMGWQRCRDRPGVTWWPLAIPLLLAGWMKEDALMLPLVLVGAQWVAAKWTGTVDPPKRSAVVAATSLWVAMNAWRVWMLGGFGGYETPSLTEFGLNLLRGPFYVMAVQLGAPAMAIPATLLSVAALVAALWAAYAHRETAAARIAIIGFVTIVLTNLPLMLMTSTARGYLLVLGTALYASAGMQRLLAPVARQSRVIPAIVLVVLFGSYVGVSRERLHFYAPCSDHARVGYAWIEEAMLPYLAPEFGPWLDTHIASCDADAYTPLARALPVVTWGLSRANTAQARAETDGVIWNAMSADGVQMLVTDDARTVTLRLRSLSSGSEEPVTALITVDGQPRQPVILNSSDWSTIVLPLQSSWRSRLRLAHRIDVRTADAAPFQWRNATFESQ